MRAGKNTFIVALLVLVASLVKGVHNHTPHDAGRKEFCPTAYSLHASPGHFLAQLSEGRQPSDPTRKHGEKRHGKSLVSQAIAAEYPLVFRPGFTYCQRNYSLFLPAGCTNQFIGDFPLRGPPTII
ncbi:MAG: hypothetical protein J0H74_02335 [Chitinophagaceae bacterium]|nr:hypothetical protein [Chitinophagaceae bacterium]